MNKAGKINSISTCVALTQDQRDWIKYMVDERKMFTSRSGLVRFAINVLKYNMIKIPEEFEQQTKMIRTKDPNTIKYKNKVWNIRPTIIPNL